MVLGIGLIVEDFGMCSSVVVAISGRVELKSLPGPD